MRAWPVHSKDRTYGAFAPLEPADRVICQWHSQASVESSRLFSTSTKLFSYGVGKAPVRARLGVGQTLGLQAEESWPDDRSDWYGQLQLILAINVPDIQ